MSAKYLKLSARDIDASLVAVWSEIQAGNPDFASPFLSPHFTKTVADVRDDVYVTLIENDGKPVGFLPYQERGGRAIPVGGRLNDCQAVVAAAHAEWSPRDLLMSSGLSLWDFDHLISSQTQFESYAHTTSFSPIIRLEDTFDAYIAERKAANSMRIGQFQRKRRKLLRELGEDGHVRFDPLSGDKTALESVIRWKLEQCRRTGTYPFFEESWTVDLVNRLHEDKNPGLFGALSVIWVGDDVAAAHFGIASDRQWHWWFPTYSNDWGAYSPGGVLLVWLCEHVSSDAASQTVIDLGKGDDAYKSSFANDAYGLLEGHVSNGSAYALFRSANRSARNWARHTPALAPVREVRRWIRKKQA